MIITIIIIIGIIIIVIVLHTLKQIWIFTTPLLQSSFVYTIQSLLKVLTVWCLKACWFGSQWKSNKKITFSWI